MPAKKVTKKSTFNPPVQKIDWDKINWWRVPIMCRGVGKDYISCVVPLWETKRKYDNIVLLYYSKDMPPGFFEVIKNGMEFHAEVPTLLSCQAEFRLRNVEVPKVAVE